MRKFIAAAIAVIMMVTAGASACVVKAARANTEVYLRDVDTGDIMGAMYKGDIAYVDGEKAGWLILRIGDMQYASWSEYYTVKDGVCADEIRVREKPRKSKSAAEAFDANGLKGIEKKRINDERFGWVVSE